MEQPTADRPAATGGTASYAALAAILALTLALRVWDQGASGFGTDYYAAGVRSMAAGWGNFFFNAFDPGGFVSLDKPPVAFWIQAASAWLFGFGGRAILLPQALEGVASVAILYHLVARRCGAAAGLLAALFLALTPVAVAVDRSGNTDSALVLFLLLAAWAAMRAAETGRLATLLLAAMLAGIAFNVKMLAALVIVPTLALLYLVEAPRPPGRRIAHLAAAGAVGGAVAIAWIAAFDLTPPDRRPYAGSSHANSMLELAIGHNGMERFVRPARTPGEAAPDPLPAPRIRPYDAVPVGPLRLADRHLAAQAEWLFPLAAFGLLAGLISGRGRRPDMLLWGGWALSYAVVYSAAGGIFHAYYLATLAPPLAALAAIAIVQGSMRPWLLPAALVLTAAWQGHVAYAVLAADAPRIQLAAGLLAIVAAAALVLWWRGRGGRAAPIAVAGALACLLAAPVAWSVSAIQAPGNRMLPSASLARLLGEDPRAARRGGQSIPTDDARLFAFLTANRGGERFVLAVPNARLAAPVIIHTGAGVAAIGGFMGSDPIVTPEGLVGMAAAGDIRFVLIGGRGSFGPGVEAEMRRRDFARGVRAAGRPVARGLWSSTPEPAGGPAEWRDPGYLRLYDMRPAAGIRPPANAQMGSSSSSSATEEPTT